MTDHFFSTNYSQARQRFVDAATAAGASLDRLKLDAQGPSGETLTIDIAWLGSRRPRWVLLHTSGLHGVEGFAGSAIQLQSLSQPPTLGAECALLLVHSLNPYGMAWLRRVNEENVDLNRNFPSPGQQWQGTPPAYRHMNTLLNPPSAPALDVFLVRAMVKILRHGLAALKQAVAEGQYDYPQGLFYGGSTLQQGPRLYLNWLNNHLATVDYILAIDVHTGIGSWAKESLFLEVQTATDSELQQLLTSRPFTRIPYMIQGGLSVALPAALPSVRWEALTQEFGTYPVLRVLHALREENRWHHYGNGDLQHPSKRRLLQMFCPPSPLWRKAVLAQGRSLLEQAAALLSW